MRETLIRTSSGWAQVRFKMNVTAHVRVTLIDLATFCVTMRVFERAQPCVEEICSKAHDGICLVEPVSRKLSSKSGFLIRQQHAAVRNRVELHVAKVGEFGDNIFCRRRVDGVGEKNYLTTCGCYCIADCFVEELVGAFFKLVSNFP